MVRIVNDFGNLVEVDPEDGSPTIVVPREQVPEEAFQRLTADEEEVPLTPIAVPATPVDTAPPPSPEIAAPPSLVPSPGEVAAGIAPVPTVLEEAPGAVPAVPIDVEPPSPGVLATTPPPRPIPTTPTQFGEEVERGREAAISVAREKGDILSKRAADIAAVTTAQIAENKRIEAKRALDFAANQRRHDEAEEEANAERQEFLDAEPDSRNWWKNRSTAEKIATGMAFIFTAAATAFGKGPLPTKTPIAMQLIFDAIDKDIALQIKAIEKKGQNVALLDGVVAKLVQKGLSINDAAAQARIIGAQDAVLKIRGIGESTTSQLVKNQALEVENAINKTALNDHLVLRDKKVAEKLARDKLRVSQGGLRLGRARFALDREKFEADKAKEALQAQADAQKGIIRDGSGKVIIRLRPGISDKEAIELRTKMQKNSLYQRQLRDITKFLNGPCGTAKATTGDSDCDTQMQTLRRAAANTLAQLRDPGAAVTDPAIEAALEDIPDRLSIKERATAAALGGRRDPIKTVNQLSKIATQDINVSLRGAASNLVVDPAGGAARFIKLDQNGNPVFEVDKKTGKPKLDSAGNPIPVLVTSKGFELRGAATAGDPPRGNNLSDAWTGLNNPIDKDTGELLASEEKIKSNEEVVINTVYDKSSLSRGIVKANNFLLKTTKDFKEAEKAWKAIPSNKKPAFVTSETTDPEVVKALDKLILLRQNKESAERILKALQEKGRAKTENKFNGFFK